MKILKNLFYLLTILSLGIGLTSATTEQKPKKEFITYEGGKEYKIDAQGQLKVPFSYKVKSGRKLFVSLHDSDGKWLTAGHISLSKGSGEILAPIGYGDNKVKVGMHYEIRYHIRKEGEQYTWKDAIDSGSIKGISTRR